MLRSGALSVDRGNILNQINAKVGCMSISFRGLLLQILEVNPVDRISLEQMRRH